MYLWIRAPLVPSILLLMNEKNKSLCILIFVLALAVNFAGINIKFFTDDPGLYASIAKNLVYRKQIFELFTYNQDWLDKPHFPFWMVMISFKLFGISVWAYRLPALLFFTLGLFYTWLFTKKYYGAEIAWVAVLILATSQHIVMSNTDVRAEPYLLALLIGSIYHISQLQERYTFYDLFLAGLLTACAIMTKGIFVIVPIYGALLGQLIIQKKFFDIFQFKWILLFLSVLILTVPEFYALFIQFDLHPEKTVFHTHNLSGIKWFLWDSQFGRFVNSGPITRQPGDIFFFLHTLLWAFAPWCLMFYYAAYKNIKDIFQKRKLPEYYALSGGLLLLLLFSVSSFQLPFYTNALFPLFAIVTAPMCYKQLSRAGTLYRQISLWTYVILFLLAIPVLHYFLRPISSLFFIIDCAAFLIITFIIITRAQTPQLKVFFIACAASLFANFYLDTVFYNEVVNYKGEIKAADYINQKAFAKYRVYALSDENNIFQFYTDRPIDIITPGSFNKFNPLVPSVFYVNRRSMDSLLADHADFKVIKAFRDYPKENILPGFINNTTRSKVLDSVYLITK
jgi:4-amino-4-deoxy-L-arabinose transferase-like glycosyltransferase